MLILISELRSKLSDNGADVYHDQFVALSSTDIDA